MKKTNLFQVILQAIAMSLMYIPGGVVLQAYVKSYTMGRYGLISSWKWSYDIQLSIFDSGLSGWNCGFIAYILTGVIALSILWNFILCFNKIKNNVIVSLLLPISQVGLITWFLLVCGENKIYSTHMESYDIGVLSYVLLAVLGISFIVSIIDTVARSRENKRLKQSLGV